MSSVTIYHNPRCSKSRQTLDLLRAKSVEPRIVEYLNDTPDLQTLASLVKKLGIRPIDLIRRGEEPFKALNLAEKADDDDAVLRAMVEHPVLIERPIVVKGNQARIGRPPERVLELL